MCIALWLDAHCLMGCVLPCDLMRSVWWDEYCLVINLICMTPPMFNIDQAQVNSDVYLHYVYCLRENPSILAPLDHPALPDPGVLQELLLLKRIWCWSFAILCEVSFQVISLRLVSFFFNYFIFLVCRVCTEKIKKTLRCKFLRLGFPGCSRPIIVMHSYVLFSFRT